MPRAALMSDAAFASHVSALRRRLAEGLPGESALSAMAPSGRRHTPMDEAHAGGCREAAALMLLYPVADLAYTVLTLRHANMPEHAGQVSLPGGRRRSTESLAACAVREAEEELGVASETLTVLGALTPVYIPPSLHCVFPYLAVTDTRPNFEPESREVAEVIEVPMADLANAAFRRRETWVIRGESRDVPYFEFGGHKVWGATAMMLSELEVVWRATQADAKRDAGAV
jgi:8-oxo-dGTP pyrophosphatase MutT (NUDIX family)